MICFKVWKERRFVRPGELSVQHDGADVCSVKHALLGRIQHKCLPIAKITGPSLLKFENSYCDERWLSG
jgi:hypothetical protein